MNKEIFEKVENALIERYGRATDPWGLNPHKVLDELKIIWPFYRYYFDVQIHGKENIDSKKSMMAISNHTGQIPIDALLICTAFATELEEPKFLRPLVERFMTSMPFIGKWSSDGGAVLGDRHNCLNLLKRNESILVFPEGVPGIAKGHKDFYKLMPFTKGFLRMAITSNTTILPLAVIGAEEFYPYVWQLKKLAKLLSVPALPLPLNLFPLPSPIDIYVGEPYDLPPHLDPDASDEELTPHIEKIERQIEDLINQGLAKKRNFLNRRGLK